MAAQRKEEGERGVALALARVKKDEERKRKAGNEAATARGQLRGGWNVG